MASLSRDCPKALKISANWLSQVGSICADQLEKCFKAERRRRKPIQEYLGFYNDLFVAEQIFEQQATEHPQFLFALGWVKAQQPHVAKKAAKKLQALSTKDIFWK